MANVSVNGVNQSPKIIKKIKINKAKPFFPVGKVSKLDMDEQEKFINYKNNSIRSEINLNLKISSKLSDSEQMFSRLKEVAELAEKGMLKDETILLDAFTEMKKSVKGIVDSKSEEEKRYVLDFYERALGVKDIDIYSHNLSKLMEEAIKKLKRVRDLYEKKAEMVMEEFKNLEEGEEKTIDSKSIIEAAEHYSLENPEEFIAAQENVYKDIIAELLKK